MSGVVFVRDSVDCRRRSFAAEKSDTNHCLSRLEPRESISINAGAATLDLQLCLDWDNRCLEYEGEGCVWAVSSWNCETVDTSVCI